MDIFFLRTSGCSGHFVSYLDDRSTLREQQLKTRSHKCSADVKQNGAEQPVEISRKVSHQKSSSVIIMRNTRD
jgi:hypothetical protein